MPGLYAADTHAREIAFLPSLPADSSAVVALRSRIVERFTELEAERADI